MLPHEPSVIDTLRREYGKEFAAMDRFHDAAVALLAPEGLNTEPPKCVDSAVHMAGIALYVKTCKQFKSIQILCERGMGSDADSLVRNLFESMINLLFILRPRVTLKKDGKVVPVPNNTFPSKLRARLYIVHTLRQLGKTVNACAATSGLKRLAAPTRAQFDPIWQQMEEEIGADWSKRQRNGLAGLSLLHLAESLRLSRMYAMVYRTASSSVHATDLLSHLGFDDADSPITLTFWPTIESIQQHIMGASMCLYKCMNSFNSRFRLGRDDVMDAAKEEYSLLGVARVHATPSG